MRLIINADDLGITEGCTRAILDGLEHGVLTSASLMANMEKAEEAAEAMKRHPEYSCGIHLCLSAGKPLTNCPSLVRADGTFDKKALFEPGRAVPEEVERELQAQLDRYVSLMGRLPDHLNSHIGIETIPAAAAWILAKGAEIDRPVRKYLHGISMEQAVFEIADFPSLKAGARKQSNDPISWQDIAAYFTDEMLASDTAFEVVLHPGWPDEELKRISSLTEGRKYDAGAALSHDFRNWLEMNGVELISYQGLKRMA